MNQVEIEKQLQALQTEFQALSGDMTEIDDEIKMQTELLAKAKLDRDSASDMGDETAWKAAMASIAAVNKRLGELKAERQALKSKSSEMSEKWGPLNKACGPLREDIARKKADLDEEERGVEKLHGKIMAFADQINGLNR